MKRVIVAVMMIFVLLAAAGCGSNQGAATGTSGNTGTAPNTTASAQTGAAQVAPPQAPPDLMGQITDIAGNKVTLKVAEMPAGGFRQRASGDAAANQAPNGGAVNQAPNGATNQPPNGAAPNGTPNQAPGAPHRMGLNFTGVTETISIPAGVPVMEAQRGQAAQSVALTDLKKDEILRIWKKDSKTDGDIIFVEVMGGAGNRQAPGQQNQGQQSQEQQSQGQQSQGQQSQGQQSQGQQSQ